MTKAEVQALIDSKLASGTEILASEHREVETALLNYLDGVMDNVPLFKGSVPVGNIPQGGKFITCPFPYSLPDNEYIVIGTLFAVSNLGQNGNCVFTVSGKTANGFAVFIDEIYNRTQDSLNFEYVVFKK